MSTLNLTEDQKKRVLEEVLNRLDDFKTSIKNHGFNGLPIDEMRKDQLMDRATDYFASNDVLSAIILDSMAGMDEFADDED
jgi:hypothetical protein